MKYGWIRDLPDHRDLKYEISVAKILPGKVDLRNFCPSVYNQSDLGSCTANAIGGAFEFELRKQKITDFMPSRLFIYYNERAIEGHIKEDSGAQLRDGIKTLTKQGVCPEPLWPYLTDKFATRPLLKCYQAAAKHLALKYENIAQGLNELKSCLANGFPFVFGFSVFESFESDTVAKTGIAQMPGKDETMLGGHAVMAVGYYDSLERFLVRNSWGSAWGQNGYFTIPYSYLTNPGLASDFWKITLIE